ncbi:MAG: acyltransferase domain-containing protein, partial [Candidatus Latescibacteria bacterium]|nr:acyltransferase domain-containing protein [Candidatus Latescibacterota bacterium]
MYMCFSKTPALTPHTHARPFDADSNGILIGEGVGMLVLKRLEDAERDKDRIYAVIRGIGTSSDGRSKSIYAPREDGQVKALKRAYEDANIDVETIGLIEAHGTGTKAGDVCEVEALKEVFATGKKQQVALGSVKSQIGHTKSAAGAAGLIKTALSLHHKVLPPTLHIETPNPKLDLDNSPLYLNTQTRPWFRSAGQNPRRGGVSAFGFGGTNFHFVLEEYEKIQADRPLHTIAQTVLLYADTLPDLINKCETTLTHLQSEANTQAFTDLVDASRPTEIPASAHRVGFVANSATQAVTLFGTTIDGLKSLKDETVWEHPKGVFYRHGALEENAKIVALFPGQGSQYVNMGRELAISSPLVRETWEVMDSQYEKPLTDIIFPSPVFTDDAQKIQTQNLQKTENAQPSIGAFSAALYKLLQSAGFQPNFVAGHSFGELTALWAAGVFSDTDFFALAKKRGQAMAPIDTPDFDPGTMLAVKASADDVRTLIDKIPELTLANDNANKQVVLAGPLDSIQKAQKALDAQKVSSVLLPVSGAFHTPLVAHAQHPFSEALKKITFHKPQLPVYSNTTAKPFSTHPQSIRKTTNEHLLNPVRFREEIEKIYADGGFVFVEVGPRNILTKLVKQILEDKPHLCVALNPVAEGDSDRSFRQALLQLRIAGLSLCDI